MMGIMSGITHDLQGRVAGQAAVRDCMEGNERGRESNESSV